MVAGQHLDAHRAGRPSSRPGSTPRGCRRGSRGSSSAPMFTRSGNRRARGGEERRRELGDHARRTRVPASAPRSAARAGPRRQRPVGDPRLRCARHCVGRERRARDSSAAITKSTCVERRRHRLVRLDAQHLGRRRGVEVVEGLRQPQPERDLGGELVRARRATGRPAPRAAWRGCPSSTAAPGSAARAARRPHHAGGGDEVVGRGLRRARRRPVSSGLPPSAGTTATRRPRSSCAPSPVSHGPATGNDGRVGRMRPGADVEVPRRVAHRTRDVAEHDGVRTHVRVRAPRGCGRTCPSCRAGRCSRPGCGSSPPPSPPVARLTSPPDTAAADPADDPPTVRPNRHGLCVTPWIFVTLTFRPPNSLAVVAPTGTDPAALEQPLDRVRRAVGDAIGEHERRPR